MPSAYIKNKWKAAPTQVKNTHFINKLPLLPRRLYTLWISRCIATARERIPGSIDNDVTGVSECSQQRSSLKDDGYKHIKEY
ncbi:hypothetical protein [Photorhabdus bodei]|uniref:hypothetical protein n=1 Tax=Photorhabdus bodei TaxID=2029681 RepID=UPI001E386CF4|nr:hypothetical protein [Photorhabdus bodei]MCC8465010.1 hypothetical protein [Photorhabdus bodei]